MRPFLVLLCVAGGIAAAASGCTKAQPQVPLEPIATIKDLMDGTVDPSADEVWRSVETVTSAAGIEEHQPRTDQEWKDVRNHAIRVLEATNLIIMDGRKVANPGEKSENPGIELGPEEIQMLIDEDRPTLIQRAHALHDAGMKALAAIDKKDVDGLSDAGEAIDEACEQCHLKYWYPPNTPEILKKASVRKAPQ